MNISQVEVDSGTRGDSCSDQGFLELGRLVLFEVAEEELDIKSPIQKLCGVWLTFEPPGLFEEAVEHRIHPRGKMSRFF